MTREQLFQIYLRYRATGRKVEIRGAWVVLDGWAFDWEEGAAIMRRVLKAGSY